MTKLNEPKVQHYISNFYLKNFANNKNVIFVFDRTQNKIWSQKTDEVAKINNYYTLYSENGIKDLSVENELAELENKSKPIIDKIINNQIIDIDEKYILASFISFLKNRTPEFESYANDLTYKLVKDPEKIFNAHPDNKKFYEEEFLKMDKEEQEKTLDKMYEMIDKADKSIFGCDRESNIKLMLELSKDITPLLFKKKWVILNSHKDYEFITSDNPFLLDPPTTRVGIETPGVTMTIPLSCNHCLYILEDGEFFNYLDIENESVQTINRTTAIYSNRFIFSKNKSLLENLVSETKLEQWARGRRF